MNKGDDNEKTGSCEENEANLKMKYLNKRRLEAASRIILPFKAFFFFNRITLSETDVAA